jgi:hypothetical protein
MSSRETILMPTISGATTARSTETRVSLRDHAPAHQYAPLEQGHRGTVVETRTTGPFSAAVEEQRIRWPFRTGLRSRVGWSCCGRRG